MPTIAQDTADNTAQVAGLFHHVVDVLAGIATGDDAAAWVRTDGRAGPVNSGQGFYIGADGNLYPRGPLAASTAASAPAASGGIVITPGLLMLAGLAFLILRK